MEVDQEGNEFDELYNTKNLNKPIKTIEVSFKSPTKLQLGQMEVGSCIFKNQRSC